MEENVLKDVKISDLLTEIQTRGFFVTKRPETESGISIDTDMKRWRGDKFKFGVVSDTHLGSRYQQLTSLHEFYRLCQRKKIDTVFHCGDVVDGESMYRGQDYEIFVHGADAQLDYAVSNYPKVKGITTKVISGNHDQSFIKTAGFNIVKAIAEKRDDMEFIGDDLAFVNIGNVKVALMHGRSGVSYARSYKSQKIVEQMSSENKPNFLFLGHYHVTNHIPAYRNVETVQMPCFQAQTPYLVAKGLAPNVGALIVEVQPDEIGIASVRYEWIHFYVHKEDDF